MPLDTPLGSAVRTVGSGSSSVLTLPQDANLRAELNVTASTAPTTLDVKIEHSEDGGTTFQTLAAFTQIGAVSTGKQSLAIPAPNSGYVRVSWTVVGTSYTFSVTVRSVSLTN